MTSQGPTPDVMRAQSRVTGRSGDMLTIEAPRASACASCTAKAGCGTGALAQLIGGANQLTIKCDLPVATGDEVTVVMPSNHFVSAALRAYLIPPLALALTAAFGLATGLSDGQVALLCLASFVASFLPARYAEQRARRQPTVWVEPFDPSV